MTELLSILKMLLMLIPFALLARSNYKANLKKPERYKQFLMPVAALVLCVVAMCLLTRLYDFVVYIFLQADNWLGQFSAWLASVLPENLQFIAQFVEKAADFVEKFIKSLNLNFWAFYVANAVLLLVYVIVKRIVLLFLKGLFKDGNLFQTVAGLFYEYDENTDRWHLKPYFGQARTFLKVLYIAAVAVGAVGVVVSSRLYLNEQLTALYYPVFSVIILGELYFFLDGLTRKEMRQIITGEADGAEQVTNYSIMLGILRKLFPDKLNSENTTVSEVPDSITTNEELLTRLEESEDLTEEAYGRFMRAKSEMGMELDFNYLLSGKQLLDGQSVLFNNPFYYDLIPYIFYPMNHTLLRHKKVLIVLGRHGTEEDITNWCRDGLAAVTNLPALWNIEVLSQKEQAVDVGIVTRSSVHDLKMHEANREFFDEVEFVVLIEPSRLVTTAQVGLNSLVRYCRRKQKQLVFCSTDKNCDGLLDALSHILMTSLREVSATNHHKGASSCMVWEADEEHLQHRMLPNISRYLGVGTELSFAALKNQIPQTSWYGGDAFPVVDIHWIAKQYYYDLLHYANLPATQETMDRVYRVSADMWSAPMGANQYITVEDESFNMFEMRRDFSTRATDQGFINVICSEYLLKDYMADNDSIFRTDPKAIPYITADYARTARNVVLRLCLRMSVGLVPERDIVRELMMIDRDTKEPAKSLWQEICRACGHLGPTGQDRDGNLVLNYHGSGEDVAFTADILVMKRRFNMDTGEMENMYCITNGRFIQLVLGGLRPAEYVAEDENGQRQYLGTELQGHVYQKYLPGQFFTFGGKYYEMLRATSEGQVLVRRASDHIDGRPSYRQVRNYFISHAVDSEVMGECRDMGAIRITRQFADIRVESPAYWQMKKYNDFSDARKVSINGVPDRVYNNKALIRIDLDPEGTLPEGTVSTLALLFNEVLRTLLAENQDYLAAVCAGEAQLPSTYSLYGEEGFEPASNSIYLIEDSQMDIGLLDAVERNLNRIFAIICDYLQWHEKALSDDEKAPEAPAPSDPADGAEPVEEGAEPEEKGGIFRRIGRAIKKFFGAIGRFFKKIFGAIAAFFKKLFGKKKKDDPEQPEQGTAEPEAAGQTPEGTEQTGPEEIEDVSGEQPAEENGEETSESFASTALFSGSVNFDAEQTPEEPEGETETAEGADGDTVDYEPEKVLTPGKSFQRPRYKDRYYLRYGTGELTETLQLQAVKDLLVALGYGNSALTQARKGKDVADMVERSFVPNQEGVHYCDFCGCELTGLDFEVLGDGRERCPDCSRTAVKSLDEFVALHDAVLRNMKMLFGVHINAPVHVQMVNSKKLHRKLGKTFIPTGMPDGRVLGVAIKDRSGYSILIENGAPKLKSTMTMVHEMTHIWQYLNWDARDIKNTYGELELEVYEGMAKWVEIQYAYLLGETATAKREELITRSRDDEYGRGFLKYADKYPLTIGSRLSGSTPFGNTKKPL